MSFLNVVMCSNKDKSVKVQSQATVCHQELSIHRPSFTHFTLVLESIHTCQGRDHSRTKRRGETSAVRSAPRHKSQNNTSKSVLCTRLTPPTSENKFYDIKFNCVPRPILVSFVNVVMCPDTLTQIRHGWKTNEYNLTREYCIASLQSNKMPTTTLHTPTILHTFHTRPGIDSHMSREGSLTH
jgi:hypothetical protein